MRGTTPGGLIAPVSVGAAGALLTAAVALRDPHVPGSWGFCPFYLATGLYCPGCGGLRAVYNLAHGDVVGALGSNVFGLALAAVLALTWVAWTWGVLRGRPVRVGLWYTTNRMWAVLVVAVAFAVIRNTGWGSFLAP